MYFYAVHCNEESQLIGDLFRNYNKNIRPVEHPEDKVQVMIKLTLTNLISLVRALLFLPCENKGSFPRYSYVCSLKTE